MPAPENFRVSPARLALAVRRLRADTANLELIASDPIAIIGMGCRFPGRASSPAAFWTMLHEGRDGVGEVPNGRWSDSTSLPSQIRKGGYLSEVDRFDAGYFGISPREAQQTDPQQRLLLEVVWEALWDAGIEPNSLAGTDAGVFAAIYNSDYAKLHSLDRSCLTAHAVIGTAHSVAAGRLSFLLNIRGPSLAIDSACSSSLVAMHLACQSLRAHECGLAIVGASSLKLLSEEVLVFSKWGMLASDGKCKTFDAKADGFAPGEGSGAVILKRLSDALQDGDRVRAVVRGTAVNHDGRTTVLTAPNGLAQEAVLRAALRNAMLQPQEISYIETHGTGTSLGDPIEIEALHAVYGHADPAAPPCIIGAVKTNLGHLEAAAGIAGLIKSVLCLEYGEIPRNLHFHQLNPEISLVGSRFKIPTENMSWGRSERPRVAGISSFGIGGTNAHLIVEEAPLLPARNAQESGRVIPLPAYAWHRERFWLTDVSSRKENPPPAASRDNSVHPLLGRLIDSPFVKGTLFESDLNTAAIPYLAEHRLGHRVLMPFAAFLEMTSAAIRERNRSGFRSIRNFVMHEPRLLSSASCRLQTLVGEGFVEIASENGSSWTTNAKASFLAAETEAGRVDLASLQARCKEEIAPADIYQSLERTGLRYGTAFRVIQSIWSGPRESLAFLRLSESLIDDLRKGSNPYGLHPALLDGCLQAVVAARGKFNLLSDDLFLPISVDHFELLRPGTVEAWAHAEIVSSSTETFSANIVVTDTSGVVLAKLAGFTAKRTSASVVEQHSLDAGAPAYEVAWRVSPQAAASVALLSLSRASERWLLIENHSGSCSNLARSLEEQGASCATVRGAASYRSALADASWTGVVYDARSDARGIEKVITDRAENVMWQHPEKDAVDFVLEFVKLLETSKNTAAPRLWVISSSAVSVLPSEDVSIAQAPLWGLMRTLLLEYPETWPVLIDVGTDEAELSSAQADTEQMLAEEVHTNSSDPLDGHEPIVAFRNGMRYVARLTRPMDRVSRPDLTQRLKIDVPGRLEDLYIEATSRKDPEPHQIEIMVRASGLNFRDVLSALGMIPARGPAFGAECSGTIVRIGSEVRGWKIGDNVLAFAPFSLQTFVTVPAEFVTHKPAGMTFAQAAGIPVAFLTAHYGLRRLAKLSAGQSILIHAATGGLGLAAVQLAMRAGARVYATAGSPEKRAFLKKLGVEYIFDSRSLTFHSELMAAANGKGVDVVLNSLSGDFIRASLDCVVAGGCFLEVGKRGIWSREEVAALGKGIRYLPFDLGEVAMEDPELIATMLGELMEKFSSRELQPLPTALYALEDSGHAFRTMAQARHIGKIVLGLHPSDGDREGQVNVRDLTADGTVLITGGLGALGMEVARWLAAAGAKNIVLAGRTVPETGDHPIAGELRAQGVDVAVERVDVASSDQLQKLLEKIRATRPPLRAVFHTAGIVQDAVLRKESWRTYCEATAPKIQGAWNLDRLTQNDPIRGMVFFSSAASILGSPGQGSYAAGNAFLDALAHHRASRGLRTLSVNWGAWASAGMAARLAAEQTARWTRQGAKAIKPVAALATLQTAIESGRTQVAVMEMNWEQFLSERPVRRDAALFAELRAREEPHDSIRSNTQAEDSILEKMRAAPAGDRRFILSAHVKACARRVLGFDESAMIEDNIPLQNIGLDSLMALEMRNELAQSLGLTLVAGLLFDYPAVDALTQHLLGLLTASTPPVANATRSAEIDSSAAALNCLSDEEAELLLVQELDRAGKEKANA